MKRTQERRQRKVRIAAVFDTLTEQNAESNETTPTKQEKMEKPLTID
jgi:hypothetical protein